MLERRLRYANRKADRYVAGCWVGERKIKSLKYDAESSNCYCL